MIQVFNQEEQRGVGVIHLELTIGKLTTSSILYMIDFKTSYKFILGCP